MGARFLQIAVAGALGLTVASAAAFPVQARTTAPGRYQAPGDEFYQEPAAAPHGLRFADLEAGVGTDPLTWSSDPGWQLHRTPERDLASASDALRQAIPAGTSADAAAAILDRAGAHCAAGGDARLVCSYRDVQTPYSGQYWDNVLWRVWLDVDNGRVNDLVVTRDWTRR